MEPVASTSAYSPGEASVSPAEASEKAATSKWKYLGMRHLQVALLFLCQVISSTQRYNLSVTIVAMVDKQGANPDYPEYAWSLATQTVILSAYNWGHLVLQIPGGLLAERFGPKILVAWIIFLSSVLTILTPLAADVGGGGLVFALRFMMGLVVGGLDPAIFAQLVRWSPVGERGKLFTLVYSGIYLGNVVAMPVSGVLSTSGGGWPSAFYVFGGVGIAWTLLWAWFGADTPAHDRYISAEERDYIRDSLRTNGTSGGKRLATPWNDILTSWPMWAIIVANCGFCWGFFTFTAELPTYMKAVLGFDLQENGVLSALPYLVMFIACLVLGITSDSLTNRKIVSLTMARKIFNTIGSWAPALALLVLCYTHGANIAVSLLVIGLGMTAAVLLGHKVNSVDLAPNFAGTMLGLSNTVGNFVGCFGPLLVGVIVTEADSVTQWRIVFLIAAAFYFLSGLFYAQFASGELQQWNDPPQLQDDESAETDRLLPTPSTSGFQSSEEHGTKTTYSAI